jgi:excisionase family DNA binding protein
MTSPRQTYTVAEVAEMFVLPPKSIRDRIRKGHIAAVNIGSKTKPVYRITEAALDQYEREHAAA